MALKSSKHKRRRSTSRDRTFFPSNLLLAIVFVLVIAGWYTTKDSPNITDIINSAENPIINKELATRKLIAKTNLNETTVPQMQPSLYPRSGEGDDLSSLRQIAEEKTLGSARIPPEPSESVAKHKNTSASLPRSAIHHQDGIFPIFAVKKTFIYQEADFNAKRIAIVDSGSEMRSYDRENGWHRVVIPSSNIIGWIPEANVVAR